MKEQLELVKVGQVAASDAMKRLHPVENAKQKAVPAKSSTSVDKVSICILCKSVALQSTGNDKPPAEKETFSQSESSKCVLPRRRNSVAKALTSTDDHPSTATSALLQRMPPS